MARPSISTLETAQRIELAKAKTNRLVENLIALFPVHEANQIIVYTPQLASQIPTSYAANAYNSFVDASLRFEVVRACALFDPCQDNDLKMESIPAVIRLINDAGVLDALEQAAFISQSPPLDACIYNKPDDPQLNAQISAALIAHGIETGKARAARSRRCLELAIAKAVRFENSAKWKAVKNWRDKHIAHSLELTKLEEKETVRAMKFGEEKHLLWKAVSIVDALHIGINGTGMSWTLSVRMARRNARMLWRNCHFNIPVRS